MHIINSHYTSPNKALTDMSQSPKESNRENGSLFRNILTHFIELINRLNGVRNYFQNKTISILSKGYNPIVQMFRNCFQESPEPEQPNFVEVAQRLREVLPQLRKDVGSIQHSFKSPSTFLQDLQKAKAISHHIKHTLDQLAFFLSESISPISPEMGKDLNQLQGEYLALGKEFNAELGKLSTLIVDSFCNIYEYFMPTYVKMNETVRNEFLLHAKIINEVVLNVADERAKVIFKERYENLEKVSLMQSLASVELPLPLKNIGNSCYLDAALQIAFCLPELRKKLQNELQHENPNKPDPDALEKRKKIQQCLINLIRYAPEPGSDLQYMIRVVQKDQPLTELRESIFKSDLDKIEFPMSALYTQLDAAFVMQLLLTSILDEKFVIQRIEASEEIPGRVFYSKPDDCRIISIPMLEKHADLQGYVNSYFQARILEKDGRKFKPKDGIRTRENENPNIPLDQPYTPEKIAVLYRLKNLPKVICIQLKRFFRDRVNDEYKIYDLVKLPEDGIIDFAKVYSGDNDEEVSPNTKYEIMGYVIHQGGIGGGHYVARVRIGNRFFFCNDLDNPPFVECTREEFYNEREVYMLMLRQVEIQT